MTRTRLAILLTTAVVTAALVAAARRPAPAQDTAGPPGIARVVKVVDGDTIHVSLGGRTEKVRLIGIDTPESVKPNTPVECFAREASARLKALVPPGTTVQLMRDVEARDRYGRLLAYVHRPDDGLFVNLAMARDGYAAPLTIPPNVAFATDFAAAAAQARQAGRGLWSACGGAHEPAPGDAVEGVGRAGVVDGAKGAARSADRTGGEALAPGRAPTRAASEGGPP